MSLGRKREMDSRSLGVDAYVPVGNDVEVPWCPHGPALLFERFFSDGKRKKFFACAACRDRKTCPFFMWEDDKMTEGKKIVQNHTRMEISDRCSKLSYNLATTLSKLPSEVIFCHSCDTLNTDDSVEHKEHNTRIVTKEDLKKPTRILQPLADKKSNAQFLFSEKTLSFIVSFILKAKYSKVLCIGLPSVHQALKRKGNEIGSLLLDIDYRHAQFNSKDTFCYYNMFNNHFFGSDGKDVYLRFLKTDKKDDLVIILDPPFGGLMSLIGTTLNSVWKDWRTVNMYSEIEQPATVLAFPYFLEGHVNIATPSLLITDYKVAYENHVTYKEKGSKKGSPVRLFTNINLSKFALPKQEGYKFCKSCKRYVSAENRHCEKCDSCTSKDGSTYVHCELCKECVKPSKKHCQTCNKCDLINHKCGKDSSVLSCHICGDIGHKRRYCPKREQEKASHCKKRAK